jgi:crotonobetaine/carnitine-CoA ligase
LATDPDGPFLTFEEGAASWTARQLDDRAGRVAGGLRELGAVPGVRVALMLENQVETAISYLAIAKTGAIAVPINVANKGAFLAHPLRSSEARVVIVRTDLVDRLSQVEHELIDTRVVLVGPSSGLDGRAATFQELESAAAISQPASPEPYDLALVMYTGGTTGPSKGCMLSHQFFVQKSWMYQRELGRTSDDVLWTPLPMFHINALQFGLLGTMIVGGSAFIARRFSVSKFWPSVQNAQATIVSFLGSMAPLIANSPHGPSPDLPPVRIRRIMAIPAQADVIQRMAERFGVEIWSSAYGQTEIAGCIRNRPDKPIKPGSPGPINTQDLDVRIFDDLDREVPRGEVGEIVVRTKRPGLLFSGYWKNAEATSQAMRNLWYHTGDLGMIDADDYLFFVDRKDDYLRRRGENISSVEVEQTFRQHPDIIDVAVFGVPSELSEDEVKVAVVIRPDSSATPEAICRWSVDKLPFFAVPRYIEVLDDLPRSSVGRVLKRELREQGVTAGTWDRERSGFTFERR